MTAEELMGLDLMRAVRCTAHDDGIAKNLVYKFCAETLDVIGQKRSTAVHIVLGVPRKAFLKLRAREQSSRGTRHVTNPYKLDDKCDEIEFICMSKLEISTKRSKVKTILCAMCGLQVRHVAEVNRHAMCPRCFSDYLEDRFGVRQIKIERNSSRIRNRPASSSRTRNKQTGIGLKTALLECV